MRTWSRLGVISVAVACGFVGTAPAQSPHPEPIPRHLQKLLAISKDEFSSRITLKDDGLETEAMLSTLNGWKRKEGLLGIVNSDQFFRAFINKTSGAVRFQVYHYVAYTAPRYAKFFRVNFETLGGPDTKELNILGRIRSTCRPRVGCDRIEHVAFTVDGPLLRALAARYDPGKPSLWRYRLKALSGVERDEGFTLAEIAAVVEAVDDYKRGKRAR